MKLKTLSVEHFLYIIILLLAFSIRSWGLDNLPLSDFEAEHALNAWNLFSSQSREIVNLGSQPGYVLITGLLFFVFGSGNATARILSVIMGSLLALIPYAFRKQIGKKGALIFAFGLALDPGLVSLSRIAGSSIISISLLFGFVSTLLMGWEIASGIFLGLAMFSGPYFYLGALIFGITWLVGRGFGSLGSSSDEHDFESRDLHHKRFLISLVLTIFFFGTLFLIVPKGLGALFSSLPVFISNWVEPSKFSAGILLILFVIYSPLVLLFGTQGIIQAWQSRDRFGIWLGLGFLISMIVVLIYPGRQLSDFSWSLVPLWGLAGLSISKYIKNQGSYRVLSWILAVVVFVMLINAWLNLTGVAKVSPNDQTYILRWLVVIGAVLLGGLTVVLVGLAWSVNAAKIGGVWGLLITLFVYMVSIGWPLIPKFSLSQVNPWLTGSEVSQDSLLLDTIGDLGERQNGRRDSLKLTVNVPYPSLKWATRNMPFVEYSKSVENEDLPDALITPDTETVLNYSSGYRGQDFTWEVVPLWDQMRFVQWLILFTNREAVIVESRVILWVRDGVFDLNNDATIGLDVNSPVQNVYSNEYLLPKNNLEMSEQ